MTEKPDRFTWVKSTLKWLIPSPETLYLVFTFQYIYIRGELYNADIRMAILEAPYLIPAQLYIRDIHLFSISLAVIGAILLLHTELRDEK